MLLILLDIIVCLILLPKILSLDINYCYQHHFYFSSRLQIRPRKNFGSVVKPTPFRPLMLSPVINGCVWNNVLRAREYQTFLAFY